jgi:hypothetical protein
MAPKHVNGEGGERGAKEKQVRALWVSRMSTEEQREGASAVLPSLGGCATYI